MLRLQLLWRWLPMLLLTLAVVILTTLSLTLTWHLFCAPRICVCFMILFVDPLDFISPLLQLSVQHN